MRNLPAHGQLLFLAGQRPVFAEKLAHFADPEFREMFDPVSREACPEGGWATRHTIVRAALVLS